MTMLKQQVAKLTEAVRRTGADEDEMTHAIREGRRQAAAGAPVAPFTDEQRAELRRTPVGQRILQARRQVGWPA